MIRHQVNLDSSPTLPEPSNPLPVLPRPPPNQILYHQPSPTPCNVNHLRHANRTARTCPHPAITRSPIKIAPAANKSKCLPCFDTRTYMRRMLKVAKTHAQPIFRLTRWYLDTYFFSIAEVLLEQNVDPGWVHHSLVHTLKRGGMRGGGWYHNSVKTTIFTNSVNSHMHLMILDMSKLSVTTVMTILQWFSIFQFQEYPKSVGKEMPISRIVVAVPNATVVLLD
jgi:hypothetical protein